MSPWVMANELPNYDMMSVHELVMKIEGLGQNEQMACEDNPHLLAILESALRKAVIREASVGVVKLSPNGVAGDYDIIPKETP